MRQLDLSEKEKESKRRRLDRIESQYLRARRIKLTKDTFTTIQVIGRGSFGEVRGGHFWYCVIPFRHTSSAVG
jgi:hypothetical protein